MSVNQNYENGDQDMEVAFDGEFNVQYCEEGLQLYMHEIVFDKKIKLSV